MGLFEGFKFPALSESRTVRNRYKQKSPNLGLFAVRTRLELATSCVTGRHSNQLNYRTDYMLLSRSGCKSKSIFDWCKLIGLKKAFAV